MSPEEFQRLKDEEKAHLRKLRDLKQTYRDAARKKTIVDAVTGMRSTALEDETQALTDKLQSGAALQEARMELAMENEDEIAKAEADRDALRKAEAAALVAQFKAEAGGSALTKPTAQAAADSGAAKTIGRQPEAEDPAAPDAPGKPAKTIGRSGAS